VENHPFGIGAAFGVFAAVARPSKAQGDTATAHLSLAGEYAIDEVPGLAIRAYFGGAIAGPTSIQLDAGARYAIPIAPTLRLFFGPELTLGVFVPFAGDKQARFLLHPSAFVSLGLGLSDRDRRHRRARPRRRDGARARAFLTAASQLTQHEASSRSRPWSGSAASPRRPAWAPRPRTCRPSAPP
jgi:hypothetical protein